MRPSEQALAPSPWIARWSHLVEAGARVLDVACGTGRHMQWFAARGHPVLGVDRSEEALETASAFGDTLHADIEQGGWPFEGQVFGAIVVTNYLWRPLFPRLLAALAPGGVLLYETFADGNGTIGKPSRPDFLLAPGELLGVCAGLRIVAYEHGLLESPARFVQRIAAVNESDAEGSAPLRHRLFPQGLPENLP